MKVSTDQSFFEYNHVSPPIIEYENEEKKTVKIEKIIKFSIKIIRVPETDKHCIEGYVLNGDKFEFSKVFWELKRYFGGHANTKHSQ